MWWFILRNHQDPVKDGTLIIARGGGGDVDPDLLELVVVRRRRSSRGMEETLLVDLLP
jgi:hypothetical protein